jgi:hypothetical protein
MFRFLLAVAGCLGSLGLSAAPVPKDEPNRSLYFPILRGAKWVREDAAGKEHTVVVTAVKQKPNERAWVVTAGWTDEKGRITDSDTWEVSEQGLFYLNECVGQKPVPRCHLKLPGLAGEKWDPYPEGERQGRVRCVTLKSQRIKVPAGEFDAVGVETYHGKELVTTCWYAAGVGLVKSELGGGDDKETWLVLKSFTPGKE